MHSVIISLKHFFPQLNLIQSGVILCTCQYAPHLITSSDLKKKLSIVNTAGPRLPDCPWESEQAFRPHPWFLISMWNDFFRGKRLPCSGNQTEFWELLHFIFSVSSIQACALGKSSCLVLLPSKNFKKLVKDAASPPPSVSKGDSTTAKCHLAATLSPRSLLSPNP